MARKLDLSKVNGVLNGWHTKYRPRNGNYSYPLPRLSNEMRAIPIGQRRLMLADYSLAQAKVAKAFGKSTGAIQQWRILLARLSQEKPSLVKGLFKEPLKGRLIAQHYYEVGPEQLRKDYKLSNVAVRGLLLWLVVEQFVDHASRARK
jgi:hypothetical protein